MTYPAQVHLKYRIVRAGAERGALQNVLVDHQYTNDQLKQSAMRLSRHLHVRYDT